MLGRQEGGTTKAHRIAWEKTNGPIPDGLQVLHRCDNPPCCNPDHLFLGTHRDNMRDKVVKNRHNMLNGVDHPCAKLTEDDVRQIRTQYIPSGVPYRRANVTLASLSRQYGVTAQVIKDVITGKTWRHVL